MSHLKFLLWHKQWQDVILSKTRTLRGLYLCSRHYSSNAEIKNKRLYNKLKYTSYLRKQAKSNSNVSIGKQGPNNIKQEDVPLIVKLMTNDTNGTGVRNSEDSIDLVSELQEIKHDFRARILKAEAMSSEDLGFDENDSEALSKVGKHYVETVFLDDEEYRDQIEERQQKLLGTPIPGTGVSEVPCSGCGASLHCEDPSLPGYLKGEKFTVLTTDELRESVCQRCHLILHYNLCLDVEVDTKDYAAIISNIKSTNPLVIVMVDLLDIENSLFPNLLDKIGKNKQIFVVGNKIDLIPKDNLGYLDRVKSVLVDACAKAGLNKNNNIRHVALISAKTGYGVEEFINKLLLYWGIKGDVYLLGSTNTGKSTLFNSLLQSDYCKAHVRDLIHRATTSIWSGTTLNLLKFPIMNPDPWRLLKRKERLMQVRSEEAEERKITKMSAIKDDKPYSDTILTANITTTDFRSDFTIKKDKIADNEPSGSVLTSFERQETGEVISDDGGSSKDNKQATYSDLEKQFLNVRWLYDTPGVIKTEQIVNLLKPEEVKRITPKKRLIPRVFMLKPGEVMFISGLSRLDYIQGNQLIYITVFTNLHLPVHTTTIEEADTYYDKHIGGATFQVPLDTMDHLPSLIGRYFELTGSGTKESTSDIQLSSLGWISVAVQRDEQIGFRVYTPGGQGCFLREKSFLPNYKKFQGLRIKGTNKYKWKIPSV